MLKATQIYKSFGNTEILHGIDLHVAPGEFLSIMGESGSGKSTLLNILAGNLAPDKGEVYLDGSCITSMSEAELARLRRGALGFVYQSLYLLPTLNGMDNILLPLCIGPRARICACKGSSRYAGAGAFAHDERYGGRNVHGGRGSRCGLCGLRDFVDEFILFPAAHGNGGHDSRVGRF